MADRIGDFDLLDGLAAPSLEFQMHRNPGLQAVSHPWFEQEPVCEIRLPSGRWRVRRGCLDPFLVSILERPDDFLFGAARHLKHSRDVTLAPLPRPGNRGWVLRRLNYGKLRHRLRDFFRAARAVRAFRMGLRLEQAGIPTPRVLAAGELRRWRWPVRAYLLTEEIPGARTLAELIQMPASEARQPVRRLAVVLAWLHNQGLSHRDLKPSNVLFDDRGQPFLIDLDGVRRVRFGARSRAVKDLTRLVRG